MQHRGARSNATHDAGGRVVAVGTTVVPRASERRRRWRRRAPVRRLDRARHHARARRRAVDGLLTGWHEPEASHLLMLEAVAGRELLERSYEASLAEGYQWHEFGDVHLILP